MSLENFFGGANSVVNTFRSPINGLAKTTKRDFLSREQLETRVEENQRLQEYKSSMLKLRLQRHLNRVKQTKHFRKKVVS